MISSFHSLTELLSRRPSTEKCILKSREIYHLTNFQRTNAIKTLFNMSVKTWKLLLKSVYKQHKPKKTRLTTS